MTDAVGSKPNVEKGFSAVKQPKTPSSTKAEGMKTIFVGNLPYSLEQADLENFFKAAGEVVDVRFSMSPDGSFKGYAHVEFSSSDAAEKAVHQLNGKDLHGRSVHVDYARERGFNTPRSGGRDTTYQKGVGASGQTVFVRGFDKNDGEQEIRSSLEEFFGGCGDITRISIPKDPEGSFKGIAFIDFKEVSALNQALELNGSEFGNGTLTIEQPRPKGDYGSGGQRDFQSGDRSGGRNRGRGRDGGRFGDGRGRGRGQFNNDGRGRGRGRFNNDGRGGGRGSFNKPSFSASGKKTTFNDDE